MKNYRYINELHRFAHYERFFLKMLCMIIGSFSLLLFFSCGAPSGRFRIEGRLRNINQGEFYIYSPDGGLAGLDTIRIADGRFSYETSLTDDAIYMIVFPNYSELPVFGSSGTTVNIEGDVSHLKEVKVDGTDENKRMTELRKHLNNQTPPEQKKTALQFINDNPNSIASIYLIDKYLLQNEKADYKAAAELVDKLLAKAPENARLLNLRSKLDILKAYNNNYRLPDFTAADINGKTVNAFSLKSDLNIILFWATWNSESYSLISQMKNLKENYGNRLSVLSVCIDAQDVDCRRRAERDSLKWSTICDGQMWQSPLIKKFGVTDVPDNIIIDKSGRVVARGLTTPKIKEKVEERLGNKSVKGS